MELSNEMTMGREWQMVEQSNERTMNREWQMVEQSNERTMNTRVAVAMDDWDEK